MTKYNAQLVSGLALIISAFIPPAFSATVVDGGVIHFRGAIVADRVRSHRNSDSWRCLIITDANARSATRMP
jgi:hypothetical protein